MAAVAYLIGVQRHGLRRLGRAARRSRLAGRHAARRRDRRHQRFGRSPAAFPRPDERRGAGQSGEGHRFRNRARGGREALRGQRASPIRTRSGSGRRSASCSRAPRNCRSTKPVDRRHAGRQGRRLQAGRSNCRDRRRADPRLCRPGGPTGTPSGRDVALRGRALGQAGRCAEDRRPTNRRTRSSNASKSKCRRDRCAPWAW